MYLTDKLINRCIVESYKRHKDPEKIPFQLFKSLIRDYRNNLLTKREKTMFNKILNEFYGYMGEEVCKKYLKRHYPYLSIKHDNDCYEGGDSYDLLIDNRIKIDIKTASRYFHREFRVSTKVFERHEIDYFISVKISFEERKAFLMGFMAGKDVIKLPLKTEFDDSFYYCKFHEMERIKDLPFLSKSHEKNFIKVPE